MSSTTATRRGTRRSAWPPGTALVFFILALLALVVLTMQLPQGTAPTTSDGSHANAAAPAVAALR